MVQVFVWFNRHKGSLYWFNWQWCAYGAVPVNVFTVLTTLKLTTNNTYRPSIGIKFRQKARIGYHRLPALSPDVSPLEVEFRD